CAGKNRVARVLERAGFAILDLDAVGHQALEEERPALEALFGARILDEAGHVDRARLGALTFSDPGLLAALEAIVHPRVNRISAEWLDAQRGPVVLNAALLHRSAFFHSLDALIIVRAPFLVRLLRARRRDHLSWRALLARFRAQRHFNAHYFSQKADTFIVSNGTFLHPRGNDAALEQRLRDLCAHFSK
ncbi:MAG: dephospho-CoA kinase, partial [Treponema sp.]|nr:dephospho-CoA kinase [Treponema sp.]